MINLKELKRYILSNVQEHWTDLEKVRYVYIMSGKYLQKHTEFFLTLDDKLTETALSPKKLDKVYMGRLNKDEWNKMLCKTGAEFIKDVLSDLNIQSTLVETVDYTKVKGMKHHLHHYFLSVSVNMDGVMNNIFLTPAADYANIQNGFCTLRFGSEISYLINGKPFYKSLKEIPHITLTRKDIKKLDDRLGFTIKISKDNKRNENNSYQTEYLDELIKKNRKLYIDHLAMDTEFYQYIMPSDIDERKIKSILDPRNNWNDLINYIATMTGKRVEEITGNKYEFEGYIHRFNFKYWTNYIYTLFDKNDYDQKEVFYANPVLLVSKVKALCESIILFLSKDRAEIEEGEVLKFRNEFNRLLLESSKHFIDKRFVIEPKNSNDYISNIYINHKFSKFFPYVINANSGTKEDLNKEGFSEQIEYIKRIIELMFDELNRKNLLKEEEDFKLNPIFKRINIYSIRKRNNKGYGIYVSILDSDHDHVVNPTYWYKYDLVDNTFEKTSLSRITIESSKKGKYEILSNRLKNVLENIDNGDTKPPVCLRGALILK